MTTSLHHDREVAARFDASAGRFKREVGEADHRLRAVLRGLAGLASPRVLDLGCGKGRFARRLGAYGAEVVGIDISGRMLSEADGFARVLGSARRLPFADATFEAVVAVESLQHVGDVRQVIAEVRRVLGPGGRLLVVDKNAGALDVNRPWLPALAVKRIDVARGRWIYPANGPVRERWFWPGSFSRLLSAHFVAVSVEHLLSPGEARSRVFRAFPSTRIMACWSARVPGRVA